jgi:transposase
MKSPTGRPCKHPVEFRMAVAHKVISGELTHREAAKRYGVSHGSVSLWKRHYKNSTLHLMNKKKDPRPKTAFGKEVQLENEVRALKQELANLYMQVQMLKKAQIFQEQARSDLSSIITSETSDPSDEDAK